MHIRGQNIARFIVEVLGIHHIWLLKLLKVLFNLEHSVNTALSGHIRLQNDNADWHDREVLGPQEILIHKLFCQINEFLPVAAEVDNVLKT